mgnify:CR=1 FL=1
MDSLKEIVIIFVAIAVWDTIRDIIHWYWYRHKDVESVRCDLCTKILLTQRTRDAKLWACRRCRAVYNILRQAQMPIPKGA